MFDGHNDLRCISGDPRGHIDLARLQQGGFLGGLFAVFLPPIGSDVNFSKLKGGGYHVPLPPPLAYADAYPVAIEQVALLLRLIEQSEGAMQLCTTRAGIDHCIASNTIAVVLHMEGAEAIDESLYALEVFYAAGLRSLGPVWSRNTIFADGVPICFPSKPDIGGGLTEAGRRLVAQCNRKGIVIDLSHLNEKGFWDVANCSTAPLIATHSNAWALCNNARNLTDKQLDAIAESDGMVGINLATCFLRADGSMSSDTELSVVLQHIDYVIERVGDTRVGIGSDFDGAVVPKAIGDVAGLPKLREAFTAHGYDAELQKRLSHENWLNALQRVWGE